LNNNIFLLLEVSVITVQVAFAELGCGIAGACAIWAVRSNPDRVLAEAAIF
jgi:hypothetical protein